MIDWVKKNKLASMVIAVLLYLVFKDNFPLGSGPLRYSPQKSSYSPGEEMTYEMGVGGGSSLKSVPSVGRDYPPTETQDRMVVQESSMSLVVKNVKETSDRIIEKAKEAGGYMVSSTLSRPEDAPYATVVIRIPADKLKETLESFRKLAVRVSYENLWGYDVTDQYEDIESRLETLNQTKMKFEEIRRSASKVAEVLEVTRELINIQNQIDSYKGRQKYLEQTAKLAKVTLSLSTDEMALPYAPAKTFRPSVIFKEAVRSLIRTYQSIVAKLIWLLVYLPVWLPLLIIFFWFRRFHRK